MWQLGRYLVWRYCQTRTAPFVVKLTPHLGLRHYWLRLWLRLQFRLEFVVLRRFNKIKLGLRMKRLKVGVLLVSECTGTPDTAAMWIGRLLILFVLMVIEEREVIDKLRVDVVLQVLRDVLLHTFVQFQLKLARRTFCVHSACSVRAVAACAADTARTTGGIRTRRRNI